MDFLRFLFHLTAASVFWFSLWYDQKYVDLPKNIFPTDSFFKGRHKYLTLWDMVLQSTYFIICLTCDCVKFGYDDKKKANKLALARLRDRIFASLAFPLSMFVGLTFWGLMAIDRELVFPRALDPYFPAWLNHVMHTNIMVCSLIELCTSYRKYPSRRQGLTTLVGFLLTYLTWMHIVYFRTNIWVYPVLDVLNWPMRIVFYAGLLTMSCGLYIAGEKINNFVWRKQIDNNKVN